MDRTTQEEKITCGQNFKAILKKNIFLLVIVAAMALGIGIGIGVRQVEPPLSRRGVTYLRFPGDLFLQMLRMLLLPLIISSLICGTTSLDTRSSGRMGIRAILFYLSTTTIAAVVGTTLALTIKPGHQGEFAPTAPTVSVPLRTADVLLDLVRNFFPDNLVEACFSKIVTKQVPVGRESTMSNIAANGNLTGYGNFTVEISSENISANGSVPTLDANGWVVYDPVLGTAPGMNVLGLIVFSVALGLVISSLGEDGLPLKNFFDSLNKATMKLITFVIWYAPFGVMFLIAAKIVEMEDPERVIKQLSMFAVTVLTSFAIQGLIVMPLIYLVIVRKNPFKFLYGMLEAFVTMIAVASSAATLPVTMRCLKENNKVDPRVVMFIAPVGATINMDGSCLYQTIAAIFIAQINNIPLDVGQVITVAITAIASSVGAAAVPSGSLVVITMVLTSVGLPTDITLIATIDWLLDRGRGIVNILGDSIGAGVVCHLSRTELARASSRDLSNASDGKKNGYPNDEKFQPEMDTRL